MSKPIFILEVPRTTNQDEVDYILYSLDKKLTDDYHVLVLRGASESFKHNLYNATNMTEIEFLELKKLVEETTKQEA